jgi:hypothetical protein
MRGIYSTLELWNPPKLFSGSVHAVHAVPANWGSVYLTAEIGQVAWGALE